MKYYLYNSLANNGIRPDMAPETELVDAVGLDYSEYLNCLAPEDEVVLIGGDGTLNYFINAVDPKEIKNNIYLKSSGTGNDFFKDIFNIPMSSNMLAVYEKMYTDVKMSEYFEFMVPLYFIDLFILCLALRPIDKISLALFYYKNTKFINKKIYLYIIYPKHFSYIFLYSNYFFSKFQQFVQDYILLIHFLIKKLKFLYVPYYKK